MRAIKRAGIALLSVLLLSLSFTSCKQQGQEGQGFKRLQADPVKVKIHRYEQALFQLDANALQKGLPGLQPDFSFFLGENYLAPENLSRLNGYVSDTLIRSLYQATQIAYPQLDSLETSLGVALANYQQAFPAKKLPKVYTYVSGLDYENPVRAVDSVLLVALDMYLGQSSRFYQQLGIPAYKTLGLERTNIAADCMKQLAFPLIRDSKRDKTLLDWMVMQGKVLYFLDATLPEGQDAYKITYKPEQIKWCYENEKLIWSFLISQKLLFRTDRQYVQDFIADAPFTKGFSKESPGRIGVWTGWQIVRAYMAKNEGVSLQQLFDNEDSQKILKDSGYKPGK